MRMFQLIERSVRPGCVEIQVEGDLDLAVAEQLKDALERAAGNDLTLVSLQRCDFIDSTGIAVILQAHKEAAERGRRLVAYGPSDEVRRVLSITGLTDNGLVVESPDEVLDAR
jgi:anti-sigma B factor antagonist